MLEKNFEWFFLITKKLLIKGSIGEEDLNFPKNKSLNGSLLELSSDMEV